MPDASPLCRSASPGAIPLLVVTSSAAPMPRTAAQRATTSAGRGIDPAPIPACMRSSLLLHEL
eukprot:3892164-Prymnesium_polylepis.1